MVQNYSNGNEYGQHLLLHGHVSEETAAKIKYGMDNADKIMIKDLPKILSEYTAASIASGNFGSAIISNAISRFIALPAEIREDGGLIKGTLSWGASNIGGFLGIALGVIEGIKTGNLPLGIYNNIIKYGDLADSYADKGCDIIGNFGKGLIDFILNLKVPLPKELPLKTMWDVPQNIGNIAESNPLQERGFLDGNSLTPLQDFILDYINRSSMFNQDDLNFFEQNGIEDMHKKYSHLYEIGSRIPNDIFNTYQETSYSEVDDTNSSMFPINSGLPMQITPPPTMLPPSVDELRADLAAQGYSQRAINQMINSYQDSGWQSVNTGGAFVPIGDFNIPTDTRFC